MPKLKLGKKAKDHYMVNVTFPKGIVNLKTLCRVNPDGHPVTKEKLVYALNHGLDRLIECGAVELVKDKDLLFPDGNVPPKGKAAPAPKAKPAPKPAPKPEPEPEPEPEPISTVSMVGLLEETTKVTDEVAEPVEIKEEPAPTSKKSRRKQKADNGED